MKNLLAKWANWVARNLEKNGLPDLAKKYWDIEKSLKK